MAVGLFNLYYWFSSIMMTFPGFPLTTKTKILLIDGRVIQKQLNANGFAAARWSLRVCLRARPTGA